MTVTIYTSMDMTTITIIGQLTFEKGLSTIKRLYNEKLSKFIIWDFREADIQLLTSDNIEKIIQYVKKNAYKRPSGAKSALLVTRDFEYAIMRMVQIYAEIHEIEIKYKIFYDYQDAMNWFNLNSSDYSQ
jgi:hypothetical protein